MEKMLFESYTISSQNNGIYTEQLISYVEANMLSWQTKTYIFQPDFQKAGKVIASQKLLLNSGTYFFWYHGNLFWVTVDSRDSPYIGLRSEAYQTNFNLKVACFRWNIDQLRNLFNIIDEATKVKGAAIYYYGGTMSLGWERVASMPKRKIETVVIPKEKKDLIIDDINHFFQDRTRQLYEDKGINYKRGIILYGPPGCGKTSLISTISYHFGMDVYSISLEGSFLGEEGLIRALARIPGRSIVLFEDIDVAFPAPRSSKEEGGGEGEDSEKEKDKGKFNPLSGLSGLSSGASSKSSITMKGFLNAIDGVKSNNNGILFLFTTNHIEKLDEALLRAGRIDLRIELTHLKEPEILEMFRLYYRPTVPEVLPEVLPETTLPSIEASTEASTEIAEASSEVAEAKIVAPTYLEELEAYYKRQPTFTLKIEDLVNKFKGKKIIPAELSGFLLENSHLSLPSLALKIDQHKWNEHEQFNADKANKIGTPNIPQVFELGFC